MGVRLKAENPAASEIFDKVRTLCRNFSAQRLQAYARCPELKTEEIEKARQVYAHWMSLILVSGPALRITLKAHYHSRTAQSLVARSLGMPAAEVTDAMGMDYISEFCNLTAGGVKQALLDQKLTLGISLPLVTRGFDEYFFKPANPLNAFDDRWMLTGPDFKLVVTARIEIFDPDALKELTVPALEAASEEGEIDLL